MEINYCRRCGEPLRRTNGAAYNCVNGHAIYANPATGVGVYLLNEANELVVAIRGLNPGKGEFDILGGFVNQSESLEHAIARELREEAGLSTDLYSSPQYIRSDHDIYEFEGEKIAILRSNFWAHLKPGAVLQPDDDVTEIRLIPLADIEPGMFFFSNVQAGVKRLKQILL